jgi:hypothetical protein
MLLLTGAALAEEVLPLTLDRAGSSPPTILRTDFCPFCPPFTVTLCAGSTAERTLLVPATIVLTAPSPGFFGVILEEVVEYRSSMSRLALAPLSMCVSVRLLLGSEERERERAGAETVGVLHSDTLALLPTPATATPDPDPVPVPVPTPLALPVLPDLLCRDLLGTDDDDDGTSTPSTLPHPCPKPGSPAVRARLLFGH